MVSDALSRASQVLGMEWTLCQEVLDKLMNQWPVTIVLFATSLSFCLPVYYSLLQDPRNAGTDALLQSWDYQQLYEFPPFALVRQILNKLFTSRGVELTLIAPFWPQEEWFQYLLGSLLEPPLRPPKGGIYSDNPTFIDSILSSSRFILISGDTPAICRH